MPIYKVTPTALAAIPPTTFGAEGIMERKDLQRLLRDQISVLGEDLMVVAEEFGDWVDSSRRIDLLCIDSEANLVVVELKRTEDGGHMELQALRYAAMIARMTFEQLVRAHAIFKNKAQPDLETASAAILGFLGKASVDEVEFASTTRIVLAAADFSKELTTCVMWLNEYGLDIRCVRMKPYKMDDGPVLLDVEQLIPLPETEDYQTQIGAKKQAEHDQLAERHVLRLKFWEGLLAHARTRTQLHANRKPHIQHWMSGSIGRSGLTLNYVVLQNESRVELYIAHGTGQAKKNKATFKALAAQRGAIEKDFGAALDWQELPESDGCRICCHVEGGLRSPPEQWPSIQAALTDAMIRLDHALRTRVAALPA